MTLSELNKALWLKGVEGKKLFDSVSLIINSIHKCFSILIAKRKILTMFNVII